MYSLFSLNLIMKSVRKTSPTIVFFYILVHVVALGGTPIRVFSNYKQYKNYNEKFNYNRIF